MMRTFISLSILFSLFLISGCKQGPGVREITNVSYDPTREIYAEYNEVFKKHWKEKTGEEIGIVLSNGGSGGQSKNVISGDRADVVTLALSYDIDLIAIKAKRLADDWQSRLPNNSCPYTSTIVFLVRKGNPKNIKDWDDLLQDGIEIITPNPKTSGGARWNYLAAWGAVLKKELGSWEKLKDPAAAGEVKAANAKAREFVAKMFKNVKSMENGARGSTVRFVQMKKGDVLLAWENEALYYQKMEPEEGFEIIVPPVTILAEPPVAVVDQVVDRYKTRDIAEEYLNFLYEPVAQDIIARNFYRPFNAEIMEKHRDVFPAVETFRVADVFGAWPEIQEEHFNAQAIFDRILMENAGH